MRPGGRSSLQDYNSDFRGLPSAPTSGCNSLFLRVLLLRLALVLPRRPLFLGPCSLTALSWPHLPFLPSAPSGWTTLLLDWSGLPFPLCSPLGHPSSQTLPPDLPSPPLHSVVCLSITNDPSSQASYLLPCHQLTPSLFTSHSSSPMSISPYKPFRNDKPK